MVAAWISAETGVGPAMASGSQTCSGNWADLPMAPPNSSSADAQEHERSRAAGVGQAVIAGMFACPGGRDQHEDAEQRTATSPVLVVMNALMAAFEFSFSSHQCPISR